MTDYIVRSIIYISQAVGPFVTDIAKEFDTFTREQCMSTEIYTN